MPAADDTQFSTPIPLRENSFGDDDESLPNPYTRLRAVSKVTTYLLALDTLLSCHHRAPDARMLRHVLHGLVEQLLTAEAGSLGDLRPILEGIDRAIFVRDVEALLWPAQAATSAADGDQADVLGQPPR